MITYVYMIIYKYINIKYVQGISVELEIDIILIESIQLTPWSLSDPAELQNIPQ